MTKRLFLGIMLLFCSNIANATNNFKENIQNKYELYFGVDSTYTVQNMKSQNVSRILVTPYAQKVISNNGYLIPFLL